MALSTGIISGSRIRSFDEIDRRVLLIAGGLRALGVSEGDCVCILMRNDIAFLEVSYAIMMLGAYAVPINWHFKPEEVDYILKDTATRVLIGHADLVNSLGDVIPSDLTLLSVPTPPEVAASYRIDRAYGDLPHGATDLDQWMSRQKPYDGQKLPQPQSMIYTSGTTGQPKGVRRNAPTPAQTASNEAMRARIYGLKPGVRALLPGPLYHSAPNAFALRAGRLGGALFLMPRFDAEGLLRLVQQEAIDTIFMVPTMFVRLLKLPEDIREQVRRLVVASHRACGRALPARCQAGHDEMVGAGGPRVLWQHRIRRRDPCNAGRCAQEAGNGRQGAGRRRAAVSRRGRQRSAAGKHRRDLFTHLNSPGFQLPQQAGEADRDRTRRLHHQRRRRLHRRRRLCLHFRPQTRHGHLGRRQYLPGGDRSGACTACRASTTARCSAFPTTISAKP